MTEHETAVRKKNPMVYVGIGCLILILIVGVGASVAFKFFSKQIGKAVVEKAIEGKTGVKTDLSNLDNGSMSFTDEKTGTKVDVGGGKVPETFPKDFPLYKDAKVTSSLSGDQAGQKNGFWLTMTTADPAETVMAFYKKALTDNGWSVDATFSASGMTTQTVSKGAMKGTLAIGRGSTDTETQIAVVLGSEQ